MTFTTDRFNPATTMAEDAVANVSAAIANLGVDEQLGLLWTIYENMGNCITPAALGAARLQFVEGLLEQFKSMSHAEQLEAQRDLVRRANTPISRAYGLLSNNNKLAFWYQLAEMMRTGEAIPVPRNYQLPIPALRVFQAISALDFGQQITVLRQAVVRMGTNPLA